MRHGSFSRSTPLVASISHGCTRNILTASNQIILARATDGRSIHQNSKNRETSLHGFTSRVACEGVKACFVIRSGLWQSAFVSRLPERRVTRVNVSWRNVTGPRPAIHAYWLHLRMILIDTFLLNLLRLRLEMVTSIGFARDLTIKRRRKEVIMTVKYVTISLVTLVASAITGFAKETFDCEYGCKITCEDGGGCMLSH